ncbi:MAG: alpha-2-macroglobulin, partial [Ottowia sp.]|nr:alpha-2-macroglobulin [Ottowia sp.]
VSPSPRSCDNLPGDWEYANSYFVSARAPSAKGGEDFAFTWSSWQRGIEPWRFDVPTSSSAQPDEIAHTVLDRTLLRAGETVSMKHFLRTATAQGFGLPGADPTTLVIRHVGSGQEFKQPLTWRATATGGRNAESTFEIPQAARLGVYEISLQRDSKQAEQLNLSSSLDSGSFRVEEFRLPVMKGSITPEGSGPLVAMSRLPLNVQLSYISGGGASGLPVRVSAVTRPWTPHFEDWSAFSFDAPRALPKEGEDEEEESSSGQRVIADKLPVQLDGSGNGTLTLDPLPVLPQPQRLTIEANYDDPNGEVQTISHRATLWPAGVIVGVRAESWVSSGRAAQVQLLTLDLDGKPKAGVPVRVQARARITTSSRKRLVGGFYTYENHTEYKELGTVCSGSSDSRGLLACSAKLDEPGEIELIATAQDADGRSAQAAGSIWVTRHGEMWFGGEDHDRMDVLAEQKHYEPGETARFQVRMPFRRATALVTVEREGILHAQVQELAGDNPTVELKVDPAWGPNAYISVLALRGRLTEVPWYSFFTWGFKNPSQWWQAFQEGKNGVVPPTAMVDLSRPAFRFGMAEIGIGDKGQRIKVQVSSDRERYPVRGTAKVTV